MDYLSKIKENKKGLITVAVIIVVLFLAYYTYNYLAGKADSSTILGMQAGTGQNPTLTTQQLGGISTQIYGAISEDWENDMTTILSSFSQLNNDADFYALEANFGTKSWGLVMKNNYTLSQAVDTLLSATEITQVNSQLAAKGIKEQF